MPSVGCILHRGHLWCLFGGGVLADLPCHASSGRSHPSAGAFLNRLGLENPRGGTCWWWARGMLSALFAPQMSWRPQYRSSKFRNVYGKVASREHCFDGIPITKNVHDNHFCAVNARFLAIVTESAGGGSFLVIPLEQVSGTDPARSAPGTPLQGGVAPSALPYCGVLVLGP